MRYALLVAVVLIGGGILYTLVVVGGELRRVSADLDTLTGDVGALTEDVNSIADDVNAIADALAGESDEGDSQSCPAPARDGHAVAGSPIRQLARRTAGPRHPGTSARAPRRARAIGRLAW